jgi:hypothetical protein
MRLSWIAVLTSMLSLPVAASAAGLAPWDLGMTKSQVSGFTAYGPYQAFANGDLETFGGIFDDKKENVQFFFDAKGLRRIGVYLYEGPDAEAARSAWRRAYESLTKKFGKVEIADLKIAPGAGPASAEALSVAAAANTASTGKTQMAPVEQPKDVVVFSSFWSKDVKGSRGYYVTVFFDRP